MNIHALAWPILTTKLSLWLSLADPAHFADTTKMI